MTAEPRIVCLVPSITELLCDLGLAERLVGRTGFCIHPWETVRTIPKVGGTKDLKLERIRELEPTHVVVNVDENRKEDAEALAEFVPEVVVTHPQGPRDNLALYRQMGGIFGREREAERLCAEFERAYARAAALELAPQRVLYLIWREPWMTVAPQTYIAQTLALFNWRTWPAAARRALPGGRPRDPRGRGRPGPAQQRAVPFQAGARRRGRRAPARGRGLLIDGEMTSWYGSRAIRGLDYLTAYTASK